MATPQHRLPTDGIERRIEIAPEDSARVLVPASQSELFVVRDGRTWEFAVDEDVAELVEVTEGGDAVAFESIPGWLENLLVDIGLSEIEP